MNDGMKYVVVAGKLIDEIYLFPNIVLHCDFVSAMGFDKDTVMQAGFVSPELQCYGKSTSLGLVSDPKYDTALLKRSLRINYLD